MVGRRALAATQIVQICADENSSNTSSNHVWKCCPRQVCMLRRPPPVGSIKNVHNLSSEHYLSVSDPVFLCLCQLNLIQCLRSCFISDMLSSLILPLFPQSLSVFLFDMSSSLILFLFLLFVCLCVCHTKCLSVPLPTLSHSLFLVLPRQSSVTRLGNF